MKHKPSLKKISLYLLLIFIFLFLLSLISFFTDDKRINHSKTQTWKSYYALYDWNLPTTIKEDYDQDEQEDYIGWEGCVYISSLDTTLIPTEQRCKVSGSFIDLLPEKTYTGQQLGQGRLTFIVKTQDDKWRHYSYSSLFQVQVMEMDNNSLFQSKPPIILDYIDSFGYFVTHVFLLYLPI